MLTIETLLACLELEPTGPSTYQAKNVDTWGAVVFGGQVLAQSIAAARLQDPDKYVKTVHTIFPRAGNKDVDVDIAVEVTHAGRAFASSTISFTQGDRLFARSIVLLSADEPEVIRHADGMPDVPGPDECPEGGHETGAWEVRTVGGVDIADPEAVGPPELDVWTRFAGAPDHEGGMVNQALLAFATDGFLIGTAMRPHKGVGQAQAHVTLSTGVIGHTITFHEPFSAADWLLLSHRVPYAGRGRSYGTANVFTTDGRLVASFVQDNMIRPMAEGKGGSHL